MFIYIGKFTNAIPTENLQKTELQVFINVAVGNCITGNLERVWRNVKSDGAVTEKVQCAGAWYRQDCAICALLCDLSFTKYICVYLCTVSLSAVCSIIQSYIWVEYKLNEDNKTVLCKIWKCLQFWKTSKPAIAIRTFCTVCLLSYYLALVTYHCQTENWASCQYRECVGYEHLMSLSVYTCSSKQTNSWVRFVMLWTGDTVLFGRWANLCGLI